MQTMKFKLPILVAILLIFNGCDNPKTVDPPSDEGSPPVQFKSRTLNDTGVTSFLAQPETRLTTDDPLATLESTSSTNFPGQDADFRKGNSEFDFIKLDKSGGELDASTTDPTFWACVRDNKTNLVWEHKNKIIGDRHHLGNVYSWYEPDKGRNGGDPGSQDGGNCKTQKDVKGDTHQFITQMNQENFCGKNTWRLPTVEEMRSLVDYSITIDMTYDVEENNVLIPGKVPSRPAPNPASDENPTDQEIADENAAIAAIAAYNKRYLPIVAKANPKFFPNIGSVSHRWTANTDPQSTDRALGFHFHDGWAEKHSKGCKNPDQGFHNGILIVSDNI